jgi:hypothetical protein
MSITGTYIVSDLRSEIIEPSPTFFSNDRMLFLINLAQNEYVRRTRVLQSYAFTSTVLGQADYPMPSDWLGSEKIFYNKPHDGIDAWRPLLPTNIEKMAQESQNFLSNNTDMFGVPSKYYIIQKTLYIFAKPKESGQNDLYLFYESTPTPLATLADELSIDDSLYPGVRAFILEKLWRQDNEDAKADREAAKFEKEVSNGFKWKNKRILDGRWSIDVPSYVPYSYNSWNSGGVNSQVNPLNQ